jgi:signal transduction histidine kinase
MKVADAHIVIAVADEGAGLTEEDISRLFGRFQRLSARPTGGESSTGLGLSIVKRIVELHGGRVGAHSAGPGRGTTFTIRLPIDAAAAPAAEPP